MSLRIGTCSSTLSRSAGRRTLDSAVIVCAIVLLILPAQSFAQAAPVFSETGPDADAYGAADNYPVARIGLKRTQRFLVGAFSHFDQLFDSHVVKAAATPSVLKRADHELDLQYRFEGATHDITDYLDRHPTTGLLILKNDTILYEHYRYARRDTDRLTSQSMAKTITAMLVGIAVSEGAIRSIDDPASVYVPELAASEIGKTPIRALLEMASGIDYAETYDGHDDSARLSWDLLRRGGPGPVVAVSQFNTRSAPPDTVWHYAGLNSETLGLVLARATKTTVADYLQTRIWQKIGPEADASWITDTSGQELTACCFNAALRDWGRLGLLLARDGAWGGTQLIPRQWLLDATTARPTGSFLAPRTASHFYGYAYQVWIFPGERRMFALLGVHGQALFVDPASGFVLVHTAVRVKPSGDPAGNELVALWNALVRQSSP